MATEVQLLGRMHEVPPSQDMGRAVRCCGQAGPLKVVSGFLYQSYMLLAKKKNHHQQRGARRTRRPRRRRPAPATAAARSPAPARRPPPAASPAAARAAAAPAAPHVRPSARHLQHPRSARAYIHTSGASVLPASTSTLFARAARPPAPAPASASSRLEDRPLSADHVWARSALQRDRTGASPHAAAPAPAPQPQPARPGSTRGRRAAARAGLGSGGLRGARASYAASSRSRTSTSCGLWNVAPSYQPVSS